MNKSYLIFSVVIIALIGGGILIKSGRNAKVEEVQLIPTPTVALPTISDDIAVDLTAGAGNREVSIKISAIPSDIETIEYELTYITGEGLPRGVLGKISVDGQSTVTRDKIVLGTCSSGRCVYDSGVVSIDLSLKFNSPTGSSVFKKTYNLD